MSFYHKIRHLQPILGIILIVIYYVTIIIIGIFAIYGIINFLK